MIKVLWIDDECCDAQGAPTILGRELMEYAYDNGIEITAMNNYEEGLRVIETQPSEYGAVILDIREQRATDGNGADGYSEARRKLDLFHYQNNQEEPYVFTLSGEKQYKEANSPIRKEKYCSKRVYDKNGDDYKILLEDIKKIENVSKLYQLQEEYKDVLDAARETLGEEAYYRLFDIIVPIFIKKENKEAKILNEIRKYLEGFILKKLEDNGLFPEKVKGINPCSVYIGGQNNIPEQIKRSFHSIVILTQAGSHHTGTDSFVRSGKAPYLLRSLVFDLFSIIIWMKDFVK